MEPRVSPPAHRDSSAAPAPGFVGRSAELRLLHTALEEATAGQRRLLLLAGEAGIGKTRLADEFARRASATGALVVWGRCWEAGGAPAFWPWIQILRALTAHHDIDEITGLASHGAPILRELLSELSGTSRTADEDKLRPGSLTQGDTARFYLFDAMAMLLAKLAWICPLVLIFDDLHAADRSSLLMLRFLARERWDSRLLLLGTYRDLEAHRIKGVGELMTALAREGRLLHLSGLTHTDVETYIRDATGAAPPDGLVRLVHQTTEGNPFFLDEVVRLLDMPTREGQLARQGLRIPEEVRETIRHRLAPLRSEALEALAVAATIGREFDTTLLGAVCDLEAEPLLDLLGEAVRGGVLVEVHRPVGRFSFAHALIRDTLYEDLSPARRVTLHRRVGEALERLSDPDTYLPQLAHHFFQAVPAGGAEVAISYAMRAGHQALAHLAYEEALAHFERAAEVASTTAATSALRCDLAIATGQAQAKLGMSTAARATFERAAAVARGLGDPCRLALAALGCGWLQPPDGVADAGLDALLEEALEAVGDRDPRLRARLLGRRAMGNYYTWPRSERDAMTAEAVAIARRLGDRSLLAYALHARCFALWGLEDVEVRLDAATEIVRLARDAGDAELALHGHSWRVMALLERADIVAADAEIATFTRIAEQVRQPAFLWEAASFRAMRALLDGRIHDAEQLADEALGLAQRFAGEVTSATGGAADDGSGTRLGPNAALVYATQLFNLRTHQGRLRELEDTVRELVRQYPTLPVWRCALAYLLCEPQVSPQVRVLFDQLAANDFQDIPRNGNWLVGMAPLAEVATLLGDADRARLLRDLLEPYAGRHIVVGRALVCRGAVDHYLGMLAATMADHAAADRYFASALGTHERLGARAYAARTRVEWARALARRGGPDDTAAARTLLEEALAGYQALGLDSLAGQVADRLTALDAQPPTSSDAPARVPAPKPTPEPAHTAHRAALMREGEYWTVQFEARTSRLRHTKGLYYLAELLSRPGTEIHAITLAAGGSGSSGVGDLGDAGPALDPDARRAYRRRIAELDEEVEQARRHGDLERAAASTTERDFIIHELTSGLGLAGRDRLTASHTERARLNVTRAIRTTIQRIQAADPALARHLDATIRTGTCCSYTPDPRTPITWHITPR
jgi:tetratricopeptide (TPR) repeat protein